MITSQRTATCLTESTSSPWTSARARLLLDSWRPTHTSTPLSRRFRACACPCDPKPITPTRFVRISDGFTSLSYRICAMSSSLSCASSSYKLAVSREDVRRKLRGRGSRHGDDPRLDHLHDAERLEHR